MAVLVKKQKSYLYRDKVFVSIILVQNLLAIFLILFAFIGKQRENIYDMIGISLLIFSVECGVIAYSKHEHNKKIKKKEGNANMNQTILKYQKRLTPNPDVTKLKPFTTKDGTVLYAKTIYKKQPVAGYYAIIRRDPNRTSVPIKDLSSPLGMKKILVLATAKQSTPLRNKAEEKLASTVFREAKEAKL